MGHPRRLARSSARCRPALARDVGTRIVLFSAEKVSAAVADGQSGRASRGRPTQRPNPRPHRVAWRRDNAVPMSRVSVGRFADRTGAAEMEATIVRLARAGQTDLEIAATLTSQGHRSAHGETVLPSTVKTIRLRHRMLIRQSQSHPRRVKGYLTIPQLAEKLKVPRHWISDRIHNGTIAVEKDAVTRCYLFPDKPQTLRQFRQLLAGQISEMGCGKGHQDA